MRTRNFVKIRELSPALPLLPLVQAVAGTSPKHAAEPASGFWEASHCGAPPGWGLNPVSPGLRCHGVAVPSPVPDCDSPTAAPLGPMACEMPARRKLCTQGDKIALHLTWQPYLHLAMPSKASPRFMWLQFEKGAPYGVHIKWTYKMVEIYGFKVLSRLLRWFRVESEPKPLIAHTDLGGIWNLDPLLKSASDSSLATDMVFYGFISILGGHFHACLVADREGGDLYMIYIQCNAFISTSLFL